MPYIAKIKNPSKARVRNPNFFFLAQANHQWSPWRRTGNQATNQSPNLRIHQLEFSNNHQLSGYSSDSNGILYSICQTNLDNGELARAKGL